MTFETFTAWQALLVATLTAAAIVWIFFLKVRQPRAIVPSLLLWRRVLDEQRADSLLERLRRLVSLLVAIAIALLVALAPGRPQARAAAGEPRTVALVLDTSPTMLARGGDGRTRWDRASEAARRIVEAGGPADRFRIGDTGGSWRTGPSATRREALAALEEMSPGGRVSGAPRIEAGRVDGYLLSDGVLVREAPRGFRRVSVFEPADNVGITAFEIRSDPADPSRSLAYVEVSSFARASRDVVLTIGQASLKAGSGGDENRASANPGGTSLQAGSDRRAPAIRRILQLRPGERVAETIELAGFTGGEVRATIETKGDALDLDDVAVGYLPPRRRLRTLLVTTGNPYLEPLLSVDLRVELATVSPLGYRADAVSDVYIFDGFVPSPLPERPALVFLPRQAGARPAPVTTEMGRRLGELVRTGVSAWDQGHPVLSAVSFGDVQIERAARLELSGARVLASAGDAPLIAAVDAPVRRVLVAFELRDSDLPIRVAFPIFMQNALAWLAGEPAILARTLGTVHVPLAGGRVTTADAPVASASALGVTTFEAARPGLFRVDAREGRAYVAVNAADRALSDVNRSAFGRSDPLPDAGRPRLGGELWRVMLLVAIALLAAEWWTYHRRITV